MAAAPVARHVIGKGPHAFDLVVYLEHVAPQRWLNSWIEGIDIAYRRIQLL